jgi:hypothetical protein
VDFLDLQLHFVCPRIGIEASQSKEVIPLCRSSCHNRSVHVGWPATVASRVFAISDSGSSALFKLASRYRMANAHPEIIHDLLNWQPPLNTKQRLYDTVLPARMPIVLRYHPSTKNAWYRTLNQVPIPAELGISLVVAWKNSLPSLAGNVSQHNRDLCKKGFLVMREGALCVSTSPEPLHKYKCTELL